MRTIVHGKRQWFFVAALGVILLAAALVIFFPTVPISAGQAQNLRGFAWSDTIGWISFNCLSDGPNGCAPPLGVDYGVNIDTDTGLVSGWAWSDNIGWISFNANGCPPGAACPFGQPQVQGGELRGWARACAGTVNGDCNDPAPRTDGWDGWISLNCQNPGPQPGGGCGISNYAVTVAADPDDPSCNVLGGFAWGSNVVGWISFSGVNYGVAGACVAPPLAVSCEAKPNPVFVNRDTTWTATVDAGGKAPFNYDWVFDKGVAGEETNRNGNPITMSYSRVGLHTAEVTVTDSKNKTAVANCTVNVIRYRREIRPEPL